MNKVAKEVESKVEPKEIEATIKEKTEEVKNTVEEKAESREFSVVVRDSIVPRNELGFDRLHWRNPI